MNDLEELLKIINKAEREFHIKLSWGAREMLTIPVVESIITGRESNWKNVEKSVFKILSKASEDSLNIGGIGTIDAISIIRAFHECYCSIPPFCSPTRE